MPSGSGAPSIGVWVPLAAVVLAVGCGVVLGLPLGLLVAAGGILVIVILLVWSSVLSLTGSTPLTLEEAVGFGAPSVEEERKHAVLRALKDLEYERSVGKISEVDYHELSARYRTEAKELLRALDRDLSPLRREVLEKIEARLGKDTAKTTADDESMADSDDRAPFGPSAAEAAPADEPDGSETSTGDEADASGEPTETSEGTSRKGDEPGSASNSERGAATDDATLICPACGTENDADAKFCKACAAPVRSEES